MPNGEIEQILQGLAAMDLQGSAKAPKEPTPAPVPAAVPPTAAAPAAAVPPTRAELAPPANAAPARPILGQKDLNAASQRPPGRSAAKKAREVIEISSDSSTEVPLPARNTKPARLMRLTRQCELAVDNKQLAALVGEFLAILNTGTSRTLTKEGFSFLDALYKQLADPSIFIVPMRTSQRRSTRAPAPAQEVTNEERRSRLSNLRASVPYALSNRQLARLVADFGTLTDKAGKKLSKDSFVFLEGVGSRLTALSGAET